MARTREVQDNGITLGSELPAVPLGPVNEKSLEAEAAALGENFAEVTHSRADLLADAEEMAEGHGDVTDLKERDYAVTEHLFERIVLLARILAPAGAKGDVAEAVSTDATARAEGHRLKLLELRASIAAIGRAAGLPSSLFSLLTNRSNRINVVMMRMEEILSNVADFHKRMPDRKKLDALAAAARATIDAEKAARRASRVTRAERTLDTRQQERYERLLLNVLQYVSAQGLAAYGDDPVRERRYRLDHLYADRSPSPAPVDAPPTA